jgi:hypothetical protein
MRKKSRLADPIRITIPPKERKRLGMEPKSERAAPNEQRLREVLLKLEAVRNQLDLIATTAATQSVALGRKNGAHSSEVAKVIRRHIADALLMQAWTLDAIARLLVRLGL